MENVASAEHRSSQHSGARRGRPHRWRLAMLVLILIGLTWIWWAQRKDRLDRELLGAVIESEASKVHQLLESGADADVRFSLVSERKESISFLEWLLSFVRTHRAERHPIDKTALLIAVGSGHTEIARDLVLHGANVNVRMATGTTPFIVACMRQDPSLGQVLLDHGANWRLKSADGLTPVQLTARSGNARLLQELIRRGASFALTDKRGRTPLVIAAEARQEASVRVLLDSGARPDELNAVASSPLQWAAAQGSPALIARLWDAMDARSRAAAGPQAVSNAVSSGSIDAAKALLDRKARCTGGAVPEPPLHMAAARGNVEMVELLLEHGADVREPDATGSTALIHANNIPSVTAVLLRHGAEPNAADNMGRTALMQCYNADVARLLLKAGADPNVRDRTGATPIHFAFATEVTTLLLQHGADPNIADNQGVTPLMKAVSQQNPPLVRLFLQHGAHANDADYLGNTALAEAARLPVPVGAGPTAPPLQIIQMLTVRGASLTVPRTAWRGTAPSVASLIAPRATVIGTPTSQPTMSRASGGVGGFGAGPAAIAGGGGVSRQSSRGPAVRRYGAPGRPAPPR